MKNLILLGALIMLSSCALTKKKLVSMDTRTPSSTLAASEHKQGIVCGKHATDKVKAIVNFNGMFAAKLDPLHPLTLGMPGYGTAVSPSQVKTISTPVFISRDSSEVGRYFKACASITTNHPNGNH